MKGQKCSPEFSRGESWEQHVARGAGTRLWAVLTLHCHLQHAALLPRLVGGHALVQPRAHLRQVLQQDLPGVRNVWKTGKIKWVYPLGNQTDQETSAVGSAQRPKLICGVKSTPERCKGRKKEERKGKEGGKGGASPQGQPQRWEECWSITVTTTVTPELRGKERSTY